MRISRYLYRTVLAVVMIAGVTSFAGVVFVRSAYPTISGERRIAGVHAAVRSGRTDLPGGGEPDHTARERALTSGELAELRVSGRLRMLGALPRTGSNSWVISGERTSDGVPLLANDPHLELGLPSLWYEMELEYGDHHWVCGFTIPGAPTVVVGHNSDVAWGSRTPRTLRISSSSDVMRRTPINSSVTASGIQRMSRRARSS